MKTEYPEIRVTLWPDQEDGSFCAIVMDYDTEQKTWYNTGIVVRMMDPMDAFAEALQRFKERKER